MRWTSLLALTSACFLQAMASAQGPVTSNKKPDIAQQQRAAAELRKYPDIAYQQRAFQLFWFLAQDKRRERGYEASSPESQRVEHAVDLIGHELYEQGVFMALDKPLSKEKMERL